MQPEVLIEDSSLLVLNKPAGLTVNRSDTTSNDKTLQDIVEEYLHISPQERVGPRIDTYDIEAAFKSRAGIVHRLDKETSGAIIIAKTLTSFENLQRQFKERRVKKIYTALSHGKVMPEDGEISVPMGRLPWNRMRFGVIPDGKESHTRYKTLKNYSFKKGEQLTLLELSPTTGRTHQIRVHMKHINHPLFGDELYAGRKVAREDRKILSRVFLHASAITFSHPDTSAIVHVTAPLPEELYAFLEKLN